MGERYWITGVQLGLLKVYSGVEEVEGRDFVELGKLLQKIEEQQFLGRIEEGERKEVVIVEQQEHEG